MGLLLDDIGFSYIGFNNFREELAEKIGCNLREMEGFCENGKPWEPFKDDPLWKLLFHSDCDGELSADDCGAIAHRLVAISTEMPKKDCIREQAIDLAFVMMKHYKNDTTLFFR